MAEFWVASEGKMRVPGGRMTNASVSPAGLLHAVGADDRVLCGARLSTLVPFREIDWNSLGRGVVRCPECLQSVRS